MTESQMEHRVYKFKLYPSPEQEARFRHYAGVCRLIYNLAFEQRRDWWARYQAVIGKPISYPSQTREVTALRAEFDWIEEVPVTAQHQALRDLDKAFSRFFAGESGYPSPRRKGINDSFRFRGRECAVRQVGNTRFAEAKLPKLGWVRFRRTRDLPGDAELREVTVALDPLGWHVCFAVAQPSCAKAHSGGEIGVDRGVARTLAFSDGTFADMPIAALRRVEQTAKHHQRKLSRQKRRSKRRAQTIRLLAKARARAARIRRHWTHVQTYRLARINSVIVIEALQTTNLTKSAKGTPESPGAGVAQKAGLNRSILEHGWHQFERFLAYKAASAGAVLIKVNAANTSRTCAACGCIDKRNRESQAVFACIDCGHTANADTNAAINILRAGTRPAQSH